jgi:hypothetical protein
MFGFRRQFSFQDATGSHACWINTNMRVTQYTIPLESVYPPSNPHHH